MIAHDDTLHADFDGFLGVCYALDAFEDDWAVPVFLQEGYVFPTVVCAGEDCASPGGDGGGHVVFDLAAVLVCEAAAEDGVAHAYCGADVVGS
jgi:hypothetical protein